MAYVTKSGDTFDIAAKAVYGDEWQAGKLMQANPQHIGVFAFDAGVVLATPVLTDEKDGHLPPWKFEG